ncbi:unnamed protein product, partial [Meganyctiphanes norvegica]
MSILLILAKICASLQIAGLTVQGDRAQKLSAAQWWEVFWKNTMKYDFGTTVPQRLVGTMTKLCVIVPRGGHLGTVSPMPRDSSTLHDVGRDVLGKPGITKLFFVESHDLLSTLTKPGLVTAPSPRPHHISRTPPQIPPHANGPLPTPRSNPSRVPGPGCLQRCHSSLLGRSGRIVGPGSGSGGTGGVSLGLRGLGVTQQQSQRWAGGGGHINSQPRHNHGSLQKNDILPHSLPKKVTNCTTQTSPVPSPRPSRRTSAHAAPSSHHHHHHRHGGSCSHHHHHADANGDAQPRRVRRSSQSSQGSSISYSRPYRQESGRSSDSSMSQSRTSLESSGYRLLESPRGGSGLRDSSRRSERSAGSKVDPASPRTPDSSHSSPTHPQGKKTPTSQQVSPATPVSSRRGPTESRDSSSSRHKSGGPHHDISHLHISKQRSFDVSNYPKRSELNLDRPREMALSRSYSFMSRPRYHEEEGMHERFLVGGMRSVESTPQPRRRHKGLDAVPGSPDSIGSHGYLNHRQRSDSSGVDSLATPMMHRKQRSLESGKNKIRVDLSSSRSAHTRLIASDSSPSPPSPRHEFSPFNFESPKAPDSGASTLTDKDTRSNYGRGSADSSPHSQVDSGLVSGTTGSRGSVDSNSRKTDSRQVTLEKDSSRCTTADSGKSSSKSSGEREGRKCAHRRHHHCSRHRGSGNGANTGNGTSATGVAAGGTTDSDRSDTLQSSSSSQQLVAGNTSSNGHNNLNSSSCSSSTTAKQSNNSSPNNSSNVGVPSKLSPNSKQQQTQQQTQQQQTQQQQHQTQQQQQGNSGSPASTGSSSKQQQQQQQQQQQTSPQHRDMTHLYSNLDYVYDQPVYQYIMEQAKLSGYRMGDALYEDADSLNSDDSGDGRDDSDDFADDEGMSNADSSSQEYLDDVNYLADDETYAQFFRPSIISTKSKDGEVDGPDGVIDSPRFPLTITNPACIAPNTPSAPRPIPSPTAPPMPPSSLPLDTQHGSLRRRKDPGPHHPVYSPILEKMETKNEVVGSGGVGGQLGNNRPLSISIPNMMDSALTTNPVTGSLHRPPQGLTGMMKKPPSETDFDKYSIGSGSGGEVGHNIIEKYAQENLNVHTRGLLRKKVPVMDMISWTKDPIKKPMLATLDKGIRNQACDMFKLVQIYMSDRKPKPGMTLNSVGLEIVQMAYSTQGLRDEVYVQIIRQTTENHKRDSLRRGWELLAICLAFFPPSEKFSPFLASYISRHCDPAYCTMFPDVAKWPIHIQVAHYAGVCSKRLERTSVNAKRQRLRKPTLEEIDLARLHIFRASMFGGTLEEVMLLQRDRYPHRRLPWVQTTLSEEVLRLQGTNTEGIFRVPADFDEVHQLKQVVDQWEVGDCGDSHVAAALLKTWYRELYEPLIPDNLYNAAINAHDNPAQAVVLVNKLPEINRLVLSYLIRCLSY